MTTTELDQIYWLRREIEMDTQRLEVLCSKKPAAELCGPTTGKRDCCLSDLDTELRDIITEKRDRCLADLGRLERYVLSIKDEYIQRLFMHRFIAGLSWADVARQIGGGNSAGAVKMIVSRYLKNNP